MAYQKEERFYIDYVTADGSVKRIYPRSKAKYQEQIAKAKSLNYKVVECGKLYPFSTMKHQHNFDLINNICFNTMYDMENGNIPMDDAEYDRLAALKAKAEEYFTYSLPVAWVPYKVWSDMNEIANMAILHRQECCIANGRPELVTLC